MSMTIEHLDPQDVFLCAESDHDRCGDPCMPSYAHHKPVVRDEKTAERHGCAWNAPVLLEPVEDL